MKIRPTNLLRAFFWWCTSVLVLAIQAPDWLNASVRLIPAPSQSLLSESGVWQPPASGIQSLAMLTEFPGWVFAIVAAAVVSLIALRTERSDHAFTSIALLPALILTLRPETFLVQLLLVAACHSGAGRFSSPPLRWLLLTALAAFSLLLSPDFGLVLVMCLFLLFPRMPDVETHLKPIHWVPFAVAVILCGAIVLPGSGLSRAFLRPVTGLLADSSLTPSLASIFGCPNGLITAMFCGISLLVLTQRLYRNAATAANVLYSLCLLGIGIGCGWYLSAALFVAAEMSHSTHTRPYRPSVRLSFAATVVTAVTSTVLFYAGMTSFRLPLARHSQIVDTGVWNIRGPILLTNLDHSADWQTAACRERFSLLLDDRWDATVPGADRYASTVRDLRYELRDHYLTLHGESGGFNRFLNKHKPVAIVVDSSESRTIRQLSVDPHWKMMSVDHKRTVFANSQSPRPRAFLARASQLWQHLECPGVNTNISPDGMLAFETSLDARIVASVFNAIRLPYAALRVLPDDQSHATENVKTWCYVELAFRALYYLGQPSLLDQFRAHQRLQTVCDPNLIERLIFQPEIQSFQKARTELKRQQHPLQVVIQREMSEVEQNVRRAIQLGDRDEGSRQCRQLTDSTIRMFYQCLLQSTEKNGRETFNEFIALASEDGCPPRIREESLFYAGCLALEMGDGNAARDCLIKSHQNRPQSQFTALRSQYLSQLSR